MHLPSTFEELVQLAERADKAFMASGKGKSLDMPRGNGGSRGSGGYSRGGSHGGARGGHFAGGRRGG